MRDLMEGALGHEVLEALADPAVLIGETGQVLHRNHAFSKSFGLSQGISETPLLVELIREPRIMELYHRVKDSEPTHQTSFESPERIEYLVNASRIQVDGMQKSVLIIFKDMSAEREADRKRTDFVANASHELKTPLTSIRGYLDTLLSDLKEKRIEHALSFAEIIKKNVDRLDALIVDLLDLAKLESKDFLLTVQQNSTREITEKVISQNWITRSIQCEFLVERVWADPHRVEQVLVNLLDNALKYTPSDAAITVTWREGQNAVFLEVADSGPGIPPELQSRIFERFFRVDPSRGKIKGTGLGLAIVKHVMARHGGRVWYENSESGGSKFACEFPQRSKT